MLEKRGFPLECAAAQVCREGDARVSANMFVRDMALVAYNALDSVADGLTPWRRAQLAIDSDPGQPTTMARLWKLLGAGKKQLTPNTPAEVGERASWSWQRSWWALEGGDCAIPHRTGESSRPGGAVGPARSGRGSMGVALERNLGVHCCPGPHGVALGQATSLGHWIRGLFTVHEVMREARFL